MNISVFRSVTILVAFTATAASFVSAETAPVPARPPITTPVTTPVNTPQQAMEAISAFLPGKLAVKKDAAPAPEEDWTLADPDDAGAGSEGLLPAYAAIHQSLQDAFEGLMADDPKRYVAVLDTGYQQPDSRGRGIGAAEKEIGAADREIGAAETETRVRALLARNRCTSTRFDIIGLLRPAPDTVIVTLRQHLEFFSRDTPPLLNKTAGGVAFLGNTSRVETALLTRQDWTRRNGVWRLKAARALQSKGYAVL